MMLLGVLGADISLLAIVVHFNMRINAAQSVAKSDNLGAQLLARARRLCIKVQCVCVCVA